MKRRRPMTTESRFTVAEIARITHGVVVRDGPPVVGVWPDPNDLPAGHGYVAIGRGNLAGRVAAAALAGASAFVLEHPLACPSGRGIVLVHNGRQALAALARAHRERWAARSGTGRRVVCITGTVGKSTTGRFVAGILAQSARGGVVSCGGEMFSIAKQVLSLGVQHRHVVVELSAHLPGDIAALTEMLRPDVAMITNISAAHLEFLGTVDNIASEKGALYEGLAMNGLAIANADDVRALRQLARAPYCTRRLTFGCAPTADYQILGSERLGLEGTRVVVRRPSGGEIAVRTPSFGRPAALTLAAALACGEHVLGHPLDVDTMETAARTAARYPMTATRLDDETVILEDACDASQASVYAALEVASEIARDARRLIVVLGEFRELGTHAHHAHREVGRRLAALRPDALVTIGPLMRAAVVEALSAGIDSWSATDVGMAVLRVANLVMPGDVVVIAGGAHYPLSEVARALVRRSLEGRSDNPHERSEHAPPLPLPADRHTRSSPTQCVDTLRRSDPGEPFR